MLNDLEAQARERGLLLRLKVGRPLGLWSLRLVVAEQLPADRLQLQGEMKAWAYGATTGLQLDNASSSQSSCWDGRSDLGRNHGLGA